jgi:hypothetical protein
VVALVAAVAISMCVAAEQQSPTGIRHRVLAADSSTQRIALIDEDGKVIWQRHIGDLHDLHLLPDGNILMQDTWTHLIEVTPGKTPEQDKVVWEYDAGKMNGNAGHEVQVHAFQRLVDGSTMIAESGVGRIIEVDRDGKLLHQIRLKRDHPSAHSDTRLVHRLDNGHYLVSQEADGAVREYDGDGQIVWDYDVPLFDHPRAPGHGPEAFGNQTFAALRLVNGNTLIATGNGHGMLEVTPQKQIVWSVRQHDLLGIELAWVTTLQILPNGHIVFGNCHAGEKNPQIVEINHDKHVLWTFKDFATFGNALSNSEVLPDAPVLPR